MQKIICKALDEGRLAYKVLDQNFQACNGGDFDYRPYLPSNNKPGKWLPKIKGIAECTRGWHFTLDPLTWPGCMVFLVETKTEMLYSNKQAFSTGRLLKRVLHNAVIDTRIWVRTKYPFLQEVNLQGANLQQADLLGANLQQADLHGAILWWASLQGANLRWADLRRANLRRANLRGANLQSANLQGANLREAKRCTDDPKIPGWKVHNNVLIQDK